MKKSCENICTERKSVLTLHSQNGGKPNKLQASLEKQKINEVR